MIKVGLFLGSFDPFHIGHKEAIVKALKLGMDRVLVIPTPGNPWKSNKPEDISFRNMIIGLETQDFPEVESIILLTQPREDGKYYSVDQLKKVLDISDLNNYQFYIIGGPEITKEIKNWKSGDWILENFQVLEIPRPGYSLNNTWGTEISSTKIKELIKEGNWNEIEKYYTNSETIDLLKNSKYASKD